MDLVLTTAAERPDLAPLTAGFPGGWPEFMYYDLTGGLYYDLTKTHYAEHVIIAYDPARPDRAAAKAYTVPFHAEEGEELPDDGWDEVIRRSALDRIAGRAPNRVSALEVCIQTDLRGTGLAKVMLGAMRDNARKLGFDALLAPVRPSGKDAFPDVPMSDYAYRTRDDGLPVDPWLRVHVRAGGRIVKVAPKSMTIAGTLAEWWAWTGLPFDTDGSVVVPGALAPVLCDTTHDHAVYIEPNVWVEHPLG